MGRTELTEKITGASFWSSMREKMNTKKTKEKTLLSERKKSAQKVFDRADTVEISGFRVIREVEQRGYNQTP